MSDRGTSRPSAMAHVTYLPGVARERTPQEQAAHTSADSSHGPIGGTASEFSTRAPEGASTTAAEQRLARRAENVSIAALTRRGQSRWELERTLISRELDPEIVEAELSRLEKAGLIDDATLAETVVRVGRERKGLGRTALMAELRRRHIDQEHIDAALGSVDDEDEVALAVEVAERRARQLQSLDHPTAVRRLTSYLMRKGYPSGIIRTAVDQALPGGASRSDRAGRFGGAGRSGGTGRIGGAGGSGGARRNDGGGVRFS